MDVSACIIRRREKSSRHRNGGSHNRTDISNARVWLYGLKLYRLIRWDRNITPIYINIWGWIWGKRDICRCQGDSYGPLRRQTNYWDYGPPSLDCRMTHSPLLDACVVFIFLYHLAIVIWLHSKRKKGGGEANVAMQLNMWHPPTIHIERERERDKDVEKEYWIPILTHDIRQLFFLIPVESHSGLIATTSRHFQRKRRTHQNKTKQTKYSNLDAFELFPYIYFRLISLETTARQELLFSRRHPHQHYAIFTNIWFVFTRHFSFFFFRKSIPTFFVIFFVCVCLFLN